MKDRNYPVILGLKRNGKPTKACLGIRTKNGASYDVVIMGLKENQPDINNCTKSKKVIGIFKVNVGTINNSLVNTAGIFTRLLLCGATHFIIAHNHPSGNVSPSPEDEKVTENIKKISEMMGIIFCDHIIIGSGYFSFLEQNMM